MCDCYWTSCKFCEEQIPVHIQDFNYNRDDLEVFCEKHLPTERATIFTLTSEEDKLPKGWRCAFRLLGGKVEPFSAGVTPNLANECEAVALDSCASINFCPHCGKHLREEQ